MRVGAAERKARARSPSIKTAYPSAFSQSKAPVPDPPTLKSAPDRASHTQFHASRCIAKQRSDAQRRKQWDAAREWAERGIGVYGDQAGHPSTGTGASKRLRVRKTVPRRRCNAPGLATCRCAHVQGEAHGQLGRLVANGGVTRFPLGASEKTLPPMPAIRTVVTRNRLCLLGIAATSDSVWPSLGQVG